MQVFKLSASSLKEKKMEKKNLEIYTLLYCVIYCVLKQSSEDNLRKAVLSLPCRSQGLNSAQAMFLPLKQFFKKL